MAQQFSVFMLLVLFGMCILIGPTGVNGVLVGSRRCRMICTREYRPVCGTDGRTYPNLCVLRARNYCVGTRVQIAYKGRCKFYPRY